jgi:beta-phosphoglucomutase-like phosphatase (HAD superfamily)
MPGKQAAEKGAGSDAASTPSNYLTIRDNCVAVEDSERGLAAARAAGLRCLVIPNDMTRACNFRGATAILPRAAAVLDALADL